MSSNVRLEAVVAAHESGAGRHRHVHLEPMRPVAPHDENETDQRVGRKGNKPPPTAPRPKLSRASSLGRHQSRDGETSFAGYRPKDNLYNKTISWLKNLKPWNKHGNTGAATSHNSISSTAVTNGDSGNNHSKDSLYFINSGTGSMSNLNHHHHYQPHHYHQNYRKSGSLKGGRLSSSISDRNLSLHIPRHDDDATCAGLEVDQVLDPGVAVHYPHMYKSGSLRNRSHSQNRYSTSFCPDRDYSADPYIDSSAQNLRDYSDPYDAYDVRYGYLNSQSCHGALPGGPQEYKTAGGQDYRSRLRPGRASQENLYVQAHFSHHDPLPHHHYQSPYQHYLNHQPAHSSNGHHDHHHHNAADRSNGDRPAHHYHQNQQQHHAHHHHLNHNHNQQQSQQQKQKGSAGREGSSEELSIPQAAAVVSGNNVTRILRQKLFGRAKSSVNLNTEPGRQQGRHGGGGGAGPSSHLARGMSGSHSAHSVGAAVSLSSGGSEAVVKLRAKKSKGLMSSSEHVYVVNREEKMLRPRSCATIPQDGKLGEWTHPVFCFPPVCFPSLLGWCTPLSSVQVFYQLACLHDRSQQDLHCSMHDTSLVFLSK
ncbi:hypothetical protein RRG08_003035 [Elysia crispata]|uniref:Uncharacterized protein n=1 Tax=Elysia crispata TaxID=231223 RepID=A0AAE1B713_9GAST|nr:hypothetical protein RRG08_003035 [Elysia crispata]